ncbi:MAG: TlpA family protein disulfide reductase, partial [Sedimentisphaerales bacterium]|nr:TlpA family protein disulfide reductase [Sedimentisphaerales bacterium]
ETKTFGCSIKWSDKRLSALQALQRWEQEQVTLETIDEQQVKQLVQNKTDKCRLINLWATWCGPCAAEFPELIDIHRMYRQREFELVTISMDSPDKKDKVLSFLKGRYASCGNYLFSSEDKYALIEAVDEEWTGALPYTLLVAPGGKVIYRRSGSIDPLELKKAIVGHLGRYY